MVIDFEELQAFKAHVLERYPEEACGVLVDGKFLACVNSSPTPTETFKIAADELLKIEMEHGRVQAILHSHPYDRRNAPKWNPVWPSTHDMAQWMKGSIPWGIVSTEGENVSEPVWLDESSPEPLEGRTFVHGITDCYGLFRDWYRLNWGLVLPNYARGMEWWQKGLDMYSENFEAAGFREIKASEVRVGDGVLMQVASPVINHAAVVTGPNEIMHHLIHRLSGTDSLSKWSRCVTKYIRHESSK